MFESQSQEELDSLVKSNVEFKQLYQRHKELDKKIAAADVGALPIDTTTLNQMKREKLVTKERLLELYANLTGTPE